MARQPSRDASARIRELRRMRVIATGLLLLMALVFVIASVAENQPWGAPIAGYVRAFAEAGVVGGCADWFAVTALFRRPLGLPIPHTAIVPRNKDRIGQALGGFIADNFLTVGVLNERLRRLELARWGGGWLGRPENARGLAARLAILAPEVLEALPPGAVQSLVNRATLALANATPASTVASRLLAAIWNDGQATGLIDLGAERLAAYLAEHEEVILGKVQDQSYKWLPTWVDRIIARKITAGLFQLLADVRDPEHPWRRQIGSAIDGFIVRLADDPVLQARGEALKQRLLDDPRSMEALRSISAGLERRMGADLRENAGLVGAGLEQALLSLGVWLETDAGVQRTLDVFARTLVRRVIAPRRHDIGRFVAQVVAGWDASRVVEKLELQAGPDLQYIRINGALVGGLVGLILYAASRAFGL